MRWKTTQYAVAGLFIAVHRNNIALKLLRKKKIEVKSFECKIIYKLHKKGYKWITIDKMFVLKLGS